MGRLTIDGPFICSKSAAESLLKVEMPLDPALRGIARTGPFRTADLGCFDQSPSTIRISLFQSRSFGWRHLRDMI
jgi:hypothetical protein